MTEPDLSEGFEPMKAQDYIGLAVCAVIENKTGQGPAAPVSPDGPSSPLVDESHPATLRRRAASRRFFNLMLEEDSR